MSNNLEDDRNVKAKSFMRLLDIINVLREKCPWDKIQTNDSLRILTIEETYELSDAILKKNNDEIKEEIGDLMLHMVFYAKISEEQGAFNIADALNGICDKLIKRHPHIYGKVVVNSEDEVKKNWEQIKLSEGKKSVLSGVPTGLPAMVKAYRLQEKTAQVGFEWREKKEVWAKVEEEIKEFKEVADSGDSQKKEGEFGDILFSLVNYARYEGINPETALERANRKFKARFEFIEENADRRLQEMSLDDMDGLWVQAKKELD